MGTVSMPFTEFLILVVAGFWLLLLLFLLVKHWAEKKVYEIVREEREKALEEKKL